MWFAFVEEHRRHSPVSRLCEMMDVTIAPGVAAGPVGGNAPTSCCLPTSATSSACL